MNSLTAIFDWLLTASLRASVLTLAVLLVQFVFRRRLSARARYALWLPVLIVLLTPVLPRSRWSIENLVAESLQPVSVTQIINPAPVVISSSTAEITAPAAEPVDWSYIRLTAWISVSAAMLLISGLSYLRTLRRFQRARMPLSAESTSQLAQIAREVGLRRAPRVWCSSAVTSPAVTGLLRPLLLLPADFEQKFTDSEARLILQHELTHLKRHDLPLNALLCVLIALHWFNPVLWLAFFTARLHREGACDAQVLENATPRRRAEYGHALLKVEAAFCPRGLSLGFVGIFERGSALRSRIQSIALAPKPHPIMKFILAPCIALMTFLGVTRAGQPTDTDFNIGQSLFREGDSIHIHSMQRTRETLVVSCDYELASADEASLALYITASDSRPKPVDPRQRLLVKKGKGSAVLVHPAPYAGMPHLTFSSKTGKPFGGIYFGSKEEAAKSKEMRFDYYKEASDTQPAGDAAAKLRAGKPFQYDFIKAILGDALRYLATEAGIQFISLPEDHPASKKLVTFSIKASPFSAQETMCRANDLNLFQDGGIWYLRAQDDPELVGKAYALPKTDASIEAILKDIEFFVTARDGKPVAAQEKDAKSQETSLSKPGATFRKDEDAIYVVGTRQQHARIAAFFKGLGR